MYPDDEMDLNSAVESFRHFAIAEGCPPRFDPLERLDTFNAAVTHYLANGVELSKAHELAHMAVAEFGPSL